MAAVDDISDPEAGEHPARRASWRGGRMLVSMIPPVVTLLAILALSFRSGGFVVQRAAPIVVTYLIVISVWAWLVRGRLGRPVLFLIGLSAFAAFAVWAGLSLLWSVGPDLSWLSFDLAVFYVMAVVFASGPQTGRSHVRVAAIGYLVVALCIAVYAYLGKVLPDVVTHAHLTARLDQPVGYWNVLALMMVMAVPAAVAIGSRRDGNLLGRALATAALVVIGFVFFFSFTRGGYIALAVCLLAYFVFTDRRLAGFVTLLLGAVPVAAVLWHGRGLSTLFNATSNDALRTAQGHVLLRWSLLAVVLAALLQGALALVHRRVVWPRTALRAAGAAIIVALVAGGIVVPLVVASSHGGLGHFVSVRYHAFVSDSGGSGAGNSASRVLSFTTGRPTLWREGIKQFRDHPLTGTGAGTFRFTHLRFRTSSGVVKHAHSEWINVLSELGLVGLALFVVAIVAFVGVTWRRAGPRVPARDRALVTAMQAGALAFVVHISWDWDWDMAAVTLVFLLFVGTLASYFASLQRSDVGDVPAAARAPEVAADQAPERWAPSLPLRLLLCGAALLVALGWLPPYLSLRALDAAVAKAGAGKLGAAAASARRAHGLDPLAVTPLVTLALVQQQQGDNRSALASLRRAAALQPQDYRVHYQLGLLLLRAYGNRAEAAREFRRALVLDPHDSLSEFELRAAGD